MRIAVKAGDFQKEEFLSKKIPDEIEVFFFQNNFPEADVYFDLDFDEENLSKNILIENKPVFANAVMAILSALPENYIRINAWNGFLKNETIEIAASHSNKIAAESILNELQLKFINVPDVCGMISPRVISMIVNEAYFALEDKISSKEEIDVAMKLGTNYPFGPFEWSEKIGLNKIYFLLKKLSKEDARYTVSKKLEKEILYQTL